MSLDKKKTRCNIRPTKKTHSKTNYEDCFVYDESRFTGTVLLLYRKVKRLLIKDVGGDSYNFNYITAERSAIID